MEYQQKNPLRYYALPFILKIIWLVQIIQLRDADVVKKFIF